MKSPSFCHTELQERISILEKALLDQKRTEALLSRSAAQKEAMLDSLPDRVVYQDTSYRVLWANEAACNSAGLARDRVIGDHCYHAWKGRFDPCGDCPLEEGIQAGEVCIPFDETTEEGRTWSVRAYPVKGPSGKILGVVKLMTDITDWRKSEEALRREHAFRKEHLELELIKARKMEAVGALAGGIAHDFNNLLQAIRGYADLLLLDKTSGGPGYRELLEIQRAARSASELTERLLSLSRKVKRELHFMGPGGRADGWGDEMT